MGRTYVSSRRLAAPALLAAALFPSAAEAQRATGSFQRTVTVSADPSVEVSAGSGSIEVRTGAPGRVEISAEVRANDWTGWFRGDGLSPEERVRRVEADPPIQQSGNTVRVGYFTDNDRGKGVSISYVLTVPPASNLLAKTGSGSQQIEGVSGQVEAHSGSGSLTLRSIGNLRASAGSGSITADQVAGAFHGSSGSGTIRATGIAGSITAKTSSGGIDVAQAGSGNVDVSSSSGSVSVRGVRGSVHASTSSGGLTIQGELAGDWRVSASSGSVRIALPPNQGFELDANTGSGSIDVDFPVTVTGTVNRRSLKGSTQGGGPLLHVRTSSGGISIQKRG
jgi:hypothetical protein